MGISEVSETIFGYGHENIRATHKTTMAFTRDMHLSKKGDCIVAVAMNKALADLSIEFKDKLRKPNAKLTILVKADETCAKINAHGSPQLVLTHPTDIVVRRSDYVCNRTLAVHANQAAIDLSRNLVEKLKNPKQKVKIKLIVHV